MILTVAAAVAAAVTTIMATAVELFTMGLYRVKMGGSCLREFWFGILEVRLKRCSFRLLFCVCQVKFYFSLKPVVFEVDLAKIKHVSMLMCQLKAKTNRKG